MNLKNDLLKGTLLLTFTGLVTRVAGFFYKIFLSRTIGAEQIGRFQLTVPLLSFCLALCGGGMQTAVSRFTAEYRAKGDSRTARSMLYAALVFSISCSIAVAAALYKASGYLAKRILLEPGCAGLLRLLAPSLPFCMAHGCLTGYFTGQKHLLPVAFSQMAEQFFRISSVLLFFLLLTGKGSGMDAGAMALGHFCGEIGALLYCGLYLLHHRRTAKKTEPVSSKPALSVCGILCPLLSFGLPLGLNRALLCVFQSIEASLLPQMLIRSGQTQTEALSSYGTLSGMALPMILFPTAVTGALGTLLLPAVSEAQALQKQHQLSVTVNAGFFGGLMLGSFFSGAFLLFGTGIGMLVFHSVSAGAFIRQLALLCPFLYISTTLTGILHGLGKTTALLLFQLAGFAIRILCVLRLVPLTGMNGCLLGLLFSFVLQTVCMLYVLYREGALTIHIADAILRMFLPVLAGCAAVLTPALLWLGPEPGPVQTAVLFLLYCTVFLLTAVLLFPAKADRCCSLGRKKAALQPSGEMRDIV